VVLVDEQEQHREHDDIEQYSAGSIGQRLRSDGSQFEFPEGLMTRDYRTEDGAQIAPLSELKDFQVSEGYKDIRGWRVDSADGKEVGKVHDLLVDLDGMRTRYLDVRLHSAIAASHGERDVLIPIGSARIADEGDVVVVPLTAERVTLLPMYDHGVLSRTYESELRRHFTLGEATAGTVAAATAATAATVATADRVADKPVDRGFYDHEAYDDRRFFQSRKNKEIEAAPAAPQRDIHGDLSETRIPVAPEDSVILKKGEKGGQDEIIVRRPQV
jgi:sporulation protein YlmC with PRC-barrel domain